MNAAVDFIYSPVINYALQQQQVPVVRKLSVTNQSETDWSAVTIFIQADPVFSVSWQHRIDRLDKGGVWEMEKIGLNLSAAFLAPLTEKITGHFSLSIRAGETEVFHEVYPVALLAYDQWNGIDVLPEMLAAFITPNHPGIVGIVRQAAGILGKWTGNPSFDAYQSRNPDRVKKQMAAIYEAIAGLEIIYNSVPAGFEEQGQRIRLADTLLAYKTGNCLDLSLLYASCLESAGIRPLIVIVKGHAMAGAWLTDEAFADAVNDDPALLTKRAAAGINEIILVEATGMNAGNGASFDTAVDMAMGRMINTADFILFVDVVRARYSGIRPLPLRVAAEGGGWQIEEPDISYKEQHMPGELGAMTAVTDQAPAPISKQWLWERKLLDLTLRNSLLNLRLTKSTIPLIISQAGKLEDALVSGDEFQILPKPADWNPALPQAGIFPSIAAADPIIKLVIDELSHKKLRAGLPEKELTEGLVHLYRSSRLAIEENGAGTLYIALGFLKWYETPESERALYAPVLLVPVELVRKSIMRGYVIRSREEETMVNITLLEKLRQDFGIIVNGLDVLPGDEQGVDVAAVFNLLRHAIMAQPRWDVTEQALLGTFSFNKFILWNDIHHNAGQLARNKIVSSLISGKLEWQQSVTDVTEDTDRNIRPETLALPVSSDSSQLDAIISSGEGKSFVLHGPPGTGKSQTITNIIANALYAGKKVLFVAAKKAALDVVEARLDAIGLGPFCLELHSNKARKSAVLEQLKRATEVTRKKAPENYSMESDRLFEARSGLNDYVTALHQTQVAGLSLFDVFSHYSQLEKGADKVHFAPGMMAGLTEQQRTLWSDLADEMAAVGRLIGQPGNHPLAGISLPQFSQQVKTEATALLQQYADLLSRLESSVTAAAQVLKIRVPVNTHEQTAALAALSGALLHLPDIPASLLDTETVAQTCTAVKTLGIHGRRRDELRSRLAEGFSKELLVKDAKKIWEEWQQASDKWFLPRWLGQRKIIKSIRLLSAGPAVGKEDIPLLLQSVMEYQEEQSRLDNAAAVARLTGFLWKDSECDWDQLDHICDELTVLNNAAFSLTGAVAMKQWRSDLATEFSEGSRQYVLTHEQALSGFAALHTQLSRCEVQLQHVLGLSGKRIGGNGTAWLTAAAAQVHGWLDHIGSLKDWTAWTTVKGKSEQAGMAALVTAYEQGHVATGELVLQFKKGLYRALAGYMLDLNPVLAAFNGTLFEEKISRFRNISKQFEQLTKEELYARLAARVPVLSEEAAQSSEIGILQKAIRNNGRALSIRKLFDLMPNLLPRLSPCMLMSPISVAQYFDAGRVQFDLVIFDEASQMPTCEAVGAIARGTSLIVVGDPKQMPPTSFFTTNNADEDHIDQEDLESILDDCLALSMPSHYLRWHYRSRHESLIAFSNARFYENKLLTFPSTDDIVTKVTAVHVPGYYDKGRTRKNEFEARAIVDEIIYRLSDPVLAQKSLGVVTFSVVQQNLIEDLLQEAFRTRPDLEKIIQESPEPIFIKNLENVQGDERDVILFSVGYGPDQAGKVSLNFGPVNREGGWRRLNVAVSRARYEMKVFSTLRADQIDINRTASDGVAGLKAFLAYAEQGKAALPLPLTDHSRQDTAFEELLASEIRSYGYEVHTGIGSSGYKIDIGIVDPQNSSGYVLGILCDGKAYSAARTSRDREIVQPEILRSLGWTIYKVWSAEWWEKPAQVMDGILKAVRQAMAVALPADNAVEEQAGNGETFEKDNSHLLNTAAALPIVTPETKSGRQEYRICHLDKVPDAFADAFLLQSNRAKVSWQILQVLDAESPVSKTLLCKRVLAAWGISRTGARVHTLFDQLCARLDIRQTVHGEHIFLWKKEQDAADYKDYRIARNELQKRDAADLPPEETANAVRDILQHQISMPVPDLVRETARLFGYARVGTQLESAVKKGIDIAIERSFIKAADGRLIYNG